MSERSEVHQAGTSTTPGSGPNPPLSLRAQGVTCTFGSVSALTDVSIEIGAGEVHGLCGENGAGKSTLIRCLGGVIEPDNGKVWVGETALPKGVRAVESLPGGGVAVIHQEPIAFPDLTAVDTIFLGREVTAWHGLRLDRAAMRSRAHALLNELGERIDLSRRTGELALAQRQMIAMARALALECRFLILDEPTASLSVKEAVALHDVIRKLALRGVGVLLVSHHLEEVLALSNRVTVLRDGKVVGSQPALGLSKHRLVSLMAGRELSETTAGTHQTRTHQQENVLLDVRGLSQLNAFEDVSLTVRSGEIVGLAGLVGAGRSNVARVLAGVEGCQRGEVWMEGRRLSQRSVRQAVRAGIVMVPEDRRGQGVVAAMSIGANVGMSDPAGLARLGMISRRHEDALGADAIATLDIKAAGPRVPVGTLSGGNQQKTLIARWLAPRPKPKLLILDEPTRGVDVRAKGEIHRLVQRLAADGAGVLLISSDLPELLALSTRILVMKQGRIAGELASSDATAQRVLALAVPGGGDA